MQVVGQSVMRKDALAKVLGQAKFASDLSLPGMLHLKLVPAERPHARITGIDIAAAKRQPGVVAVFTAADVPVNRFGLLVADQPVLADEVVRFVGDKVAAVVAETLAQAVRAAGMIQVTSQDLPVLAEPMAAMQPGMPLIHPGHPGNIAHTVRLRRGNIEAGFAQAEVVIEREYRTPRQEHAFLEPEAGLAYIDEVGRVTVVTAGQSVHDDQRQVATALDLPLEQVRIVYGPIGGAFGGREDISVQILLALAAWKLQRPVKISWSRRESILGHVKRHAMILRHKWGARRDGRLVAAKIEVISDAGAYLSTSSSVLDNFLFTAIGPYQIPNVHLDGQAVYTNNVPGGAFRGFGSPQSAFAAELQMA
ncbi:MAG TPA: molybdopterin-dependent oxidoreductase, partial [Anaerolineae bacterium]|nr:molybdopterin-dependent oxidoreductase [Anaerolineae bacterium]